MRKAFGGFTIIEVLIVLAVSGVMLTAAIIIVGGLTSGTTFNQSVYDMKSKIENEIRSVGNGLYPDTNNYTCSAPSGGKATLTQVANGTHTPGSSEDCIFLGKALGFNVNDGNLYAYTILGSRTYLSGGNTVAVTNLDQANPTTAPQLTETYIKNNSYIKLKSVSATLAGGATSTNVTLASFYGSLSNSQSTHDFNSQSTSSVYTKGYEPGGTLTDVLAKTCVEESGCNPRALLQWNLCFSDLDNKHTALIGITNTSSGVATTITFQSC